MGVSEEESESLSLDDKLLRFMEQLELLQEKRAKLNSLIEQGWFSISKARYSMGNKQVSALQYASEMEPRVFVHSRKLDNCGVGFSTERPDKDRNPPTTVEDIGSKDIGGVRRRNKPKKDGEEEERCDDGSSDKTAEIKPMKENQQNSQQDPLKWFGILVPQSLKQAQSSFQQVIELSAEIATLQDVISSSRQELSLGLKNKQTPGESPLREGDTLIGSGKSKQQEFGDEVPTTERL